MYEEVERKLVKEKTKSVYEPIKIRFIIGVGT